MRIARLLGLSVGASLCVGADATAQHSGTHPASPPSTATSEASPAAATPAGAYADTALLTGLLGTRAPSGVATIEGRVVRVTLSGDQPDRTRSWYVHRGTCTRDEGIVGSPRSYTPIVVGAGGSGSSSATIDAPFVPGGSYFVAVHAAGTDPTSGMVACGPLAKRAPAHAHSMDDMPMGNMPMGNMPMGNMPGMDHSAMNRPGTGTSMASSSGGTDSVTLLLQAIHARLMDDPVVRERAMSDPVLRAMMTRLPATTHEGMTTPAMTSPATNTTNPTASTPCSSAPAQTSTATPTSARKTARKPAPKSAATRAPKPAQKPTPRPAAKNPMPSMPGMDHSNMPGMGKP